MLDACCETNLVDWLEQITQTDRRSRAAWIARETGLKVRDDIVDGTSLSWTLDYGLDVREIAFNEAATFVNEHHRHNPAPIGWKYGASVYNGDEMIGVVMAGRPVSAPYSDRGVSKSIGYV